MSITFDERTVNGAYLSIWDDPFLDYNFDELQKHVNYLVFHCGWGDVPDSSVDYHVEQAIRLGIPYALNLYIRHWKPFSPQKSFFIRQWDRYDPPMGIFANFEGGDYGMTKNDMQNAWTKFAQQVDDIIGRDAWGVYTRAEWWNRMFPRMDWPKDHKLWDAHYQNDYLNPNIQIPDIPDDWGKINNPKEWTLWQYADKNGLNASWGAGRDAAKSICLDCFNGDDADFESVFGVAPFRYSDAPSPPPPPPMQELFTCYLLKDVNYRTDHVVSPGTLLGTLKPSNIDYPVYSVWYGPNGIDVWYQIGIREGKTAWVAKTWKSPYSSVTYRFAEVI